MNNIKKIFAVIITIVLIVTSTLLNAGIAYADETGNVRKKEKHQPENGNMLQESDVPYIMDYNEAVSKRHVKREKDKETGLDDLVFKNEDGSYTKYIYDQNIKYIDKSGEVKDIDTGIKKASSSNKKKGYTYTNGQNAVNIDFPDIIDDGIIVGDNVSTIKMYPVDHITSHIAIEGNNAIYEGAYGEGTKLIYTPTLSGVKEEIVLEEYNNKEKYTFIYDIGKGYITTLDDDCLYIYSEKNEYMGLIEPIYMTDSDNKYNTNSRMNFYKNSNGTWTVEVIPDKEFLTSDDTIYPVIIDPTYTYAVNVSTNSSGIQDATINSTSSSAGTSGSLFVGNRSNTENGISRVLMKIPSVTSSICSSIEVQSATVTLRDIMCESTAMEIQCYQFQGASSWTESSVDWNHVGAAYGELYDSQTVSYSNGINKSPVHTYSFDITVAVKEWINNSTKRQQGLLFKAADESTVQNKTFASYQRGSYQPTFTMTYVDNTAAFTWEYLSKLKGTTYDGQTYDPNCFGYAMGHKCAYDSAGNGMPKFIPNTASIGNFAYEVENYVNCNLVDRTIVLKYTGDWRKIALNQNQYLVAIRVGTSNNYHFKVQTNDGRWTEKMNKSSAVTPSYYNPNIDSSWNSAYTSTTMYLVVQIN